MLYRLSVTNSNDQSAILQISDFITESHLFHVAGFLLWHVATGRIADLALNYSSHLTGKS